MTSLTLTAWAITIVFGTAALCAAVIPEPEPLPSIHDNPRVAARWAAKSIGHPEIAAELIRICERETGCTYTGAHERDAHLAPAGWRAQVELGHIDQECQPLSGHQWGTRGAWALSAVSHWDYMEPCYLPTDFTLAVEANVAARKYVRRCMGRTKKGWCK